MSDSAYNDYIESLMVQYNDNPDWAALRDGLPGGMFRGTATESTPDKHCSIFELDAEEDLSMGGTFGDIFEVQFTFASETLSESDLCQLRDFLWAKLRTDDLPMLHNRRLIRHDLVRRFSDEEPSENPGRLAYLHIKVMTG